MDYTSNRDTPFESLKPGSEDLVSSPRKGCHGWERNPARHQANAARHLGGVRPHVPVVHWRDFPRGHGGFHPAIPFRKPAWGPKAPGALNAKKPPRRWWFVWGHNAPLWLEESTANIKVAVREWPKRSSAGRKFCPKGGLRPFRGRHHPPGVCEDHNIREVCGERMAKTLIGRTKVLSKGRASTVMRTSSSARTSRSKCGVMAEEWRSSCPFATPRLLRHYSAAFANGLGIARRFTAMSRRGDTGRTRPAN